MLRLARFCAAAQMDVQALLRFEFDLFVVPGFVHMKRYFLPTYYHVIYR